MVHSPSSEQGGGDLRPVIPTRILVDFGCAPELAPHDDADILVHAAGMQILNQRSNSLIEQWEILPGALEIAAVSIPAAEPKGHTAGAGFHEPSCHQKLVQSLPRAICGQFVRSLTVSRNNFWVFRAEVQRPGEAP